MGINTELDFEKYCEVVEVPKHGRLSHCRNLRAGDDRDRRGKSTTRSSLSQLGGSLSGITLNKSLSSSCKSMSSRPSMLSGNETIKRGSIYKSSKEVRRMKTMGTGTYEVREKIETSCRDDTSLSFRIIDALSQPDVKANPLVEKKSSTISCNGGDSNPKFITFPGTSFSHHSASCCVTSSDVSSDGFLDIRMDSVGKEHFSVAETTIAGSTEKKNVRCEQIGCPHNDGNSSCEKDKVFSLHKSSSEKIGIPYCSSTCKLESEQYSKASPKTRFSHFRRILDPFTKSKSFRSPSVFVSLASEEVATIRRSKTVSKSLINDFSDTGHEMETSAPLVELHHSLSLSSSSPAHLHGLLKLKLKHGVPIFEFSMKDPEEDFLSAKTWRADTTFNWVYTFHSMNSTRRKSSNRSPRGAKERQKDDLMVGQMQVSSYLYSELRENGTLGNSMMTEFVLYDVVHVKKRFHHAQESSQCLSSTDVTKPVAAVADSVGTTSCETRSVNVRDDHPFKSKDVLVPHDDPVNHKQENRHSSGSIDDAGATMSYPWAPADLHPNLEIAGIVIQIPFEKRESLKGDKREDMAGVDDDPNTMDISGVNKRNDKSLALGTRRSLANVKVVTPSGTHGLPTTESDGGGPSPLLERWRSNGGCDCGGWDMACPLLILDNPRNQNMASSCGGHLLMDNKWPLELFVQGAKEKIPTLSIRAIEDGQYSVDFHAQLSKLQAFSICVAILHSSEVSTTTATVGLEKDRKQRLQCNSLKVLLEEEVRFLIEAVAEGEKRKITTKRTEEHPPCFLLNPPFSPIGRV